MQDSYRCSTKAGSHNQPIVLPIAAIKFQLKTKYFCHSNFIQKQTNVVKISQNNFFL